MSRKELHEEYKKAFLGENVDFFDQDFDEGISVARFRNRPATYEHPDESEIEFEYISDLSGKELDKESDNIYVDKYGTIGSAKEWIDELTVKEVVPSDPDYDEVVADYVAVANFDIGNTVEEFLKNMYPTGGQITKIKLLETDKPGVYGYAAEFGPEAAYADDVDEDIDQVLEQCTQLRQLDPDWDTEEEAALDDFRFQHESLEEGVLTEGPLGALATKVGNKLTTANQKLDNMYKEYTVIPFDASMKPGQSFKFTKFSDAVSKAKSLAVQNSKVRLVGTELQPKYANVKLQDKSIKDAIIQLYKDSALNQDATKLYTNLYDTVSVDNAVTPAEQAQSAINDTEKAPAEQNPTETTPNDSQAANNKKILDAAKAANINIGNNAETITKFRKALFGESLETTVDQDLADTRVPANTEEVELKEPVNANEIRAFEKKVELESLDDNAIKDCEVNKVIAHSEDEKPVCKVERPLAKPLTDDPDITADLYEDMTDEEFFEAFGAALKDKYDRLAAEEEKRNFHFGYKPERGDVFDAFDDFDTEIQSDELASIEDQKMVNRKIDNFVSEISEAFDFSKKYDPNNLEPTFDETESFLWDHCQFLNDDGETFVNTEDKAKAIIDYIPVYRITDSTGKRYSSIKDKKTGAPMKAKSTGKLFKNHECRPVKYEKTGEDDFRVFVD